MSDSRRRESVRRFAVATTGTAVLAVLGVTTGRPALLLAGIGPLVYVAATAVTGVTAPSVTVERELSPESPLPGDEVTVTLTIQNDGSGVLTDLRVFDGVPDDLPVVDGSPRTAIGMRPGDTETLSYTVLARRGEHEFDPPRVRARSLTGAAAYTGSATQEGATTIECRLTVEEFPLARQTVSFFGAVDTDNPGEGLEFHSTREYRPSDRLSRVNWRRYAETGNLTTIVSRETRRATVVFVLDVRRPTKIAPAEGLPSASEYGLYAVDRGVRAVQDAGNRVGVAVLGDSLPGPGVGIDQPTEGQLSELSEAVGEEGLVRTDGGRHARSLCRALPGDAQLVLVTPGLDEAILDAVRVFEAYDHRVTALCPDPTSSASTPGATVTAMRRDRRLTALRATGARVVDWDVTEPLDVALGSAVRRWVNR